MYHKLEDIEWNYEKRKRNYIKEELILMFLRQMMLALKSLWYLDQNGSINQTFENVSIFTTRWKLHALQLFKLINGGVP